MPLPFVLAAAAAAGGSSSTTTIIGGITAATGGGFLSWFLFWRTPPGLTEDHLQILEEEHRRTRERINEAESVVNGLEETITRVAEETDTLNKNLVVAATSVQESSQRVRSTGNTLLAANQTAQQTTREADALIPILQTCMRQMEEMATRLDALTQTVDGLQKQNQELLGKNEELQIENQRQKQRYDELSKEAQKSQAHCAFFKKRLLELDPTLRKNGANPEALSTQHSSITPNV